MTEIIKLDPKEFGLEETKAADISAQFKPMLDKMVELEKEYNEVIKLPKEEKETAKKAKELRLKYVKVRTGTADIHTKQKAFYLAGGRYVDGWKNAQIFASQGIENALEDIEKHAENLEKERIAKLQEERAELLVPYAVENLGHLNLGIMDATVFNNFLEGTKVGFERKRQAEKEAKEAEEKRIQAEKEEAELIRQENEKLKAEQERLAEESRKRELVRSKRKTELQPYIIFIRDYDAVMGMDEKTYKKELAGLVKEAEVHYVHEREKEEKILKAKEAEFQQKEKERLAAEAKAEIERKALERERKEAHEKLIQEQERNERKLNAERLAREKLEKELQAKKDAEAKAEAEKQFAIEQEAAKGDKDKFSDLMTDLSELTKKYQFKSKKYNTIYAAVNELIQKTIVYGNSKL